MQEILDFLSGEEEEIPVPDKGLEEWKKQKSEARARMVAMQRLPYEVKKRRSELRANEFAEQMYDREKETHVSVGGLDSITLHVFLKSIGIDVPAISVSGLEDRSIQKVHKALSHLITENPVENVEKLSEIEKPIDYLQDWEMEALRDACKVRGNNQEEYRECLRDRALLEFLRSTAVRVGECVTLNQTDVDWQKGEVLVFGHKTKAYRRACLDDVAKYHLKKYIDSRDDSNEALFVALKGKHGRLHKAGVEYILREIAKRSTLTRRVYPHLLRKTTATNMVSKGCPRELAAFYLGHKNGNTKTLNKHYAATDPAQIIRAFRQYGAAA